MILKFIGINKKISVFDNVTELEYRDLFEEAPMSKDGVVLINCGSAKRDIIGSVDVSISIMDLEKPFKVVDNKAIFRRVIYRDRITDKVISIVFDRGICFICNDTGQTIGKIST